MKAIYDVIWEYAKKQAGNDNIDIYHLLYGYAKVMLMDTIVVQAMTEIDTEEFEKQISELLTTMEKKKLDVALIQEITEEKITGFAGLVGNTRKLYNEVGEQVKGQDEAIRKFVQGYFESAVVRSQEEGNKRPQATFLFAGPPGVGKTFMAEMVAKPLGYTYKRFDMSEYSTDYSNLDFAGHGSNYKNPSKGLVTGFVDENPKCILLFDEIEKVHRSVIYLFLQILEGGVVTDNFLNRKVSFKDTILIFTTNVGKKLYEEGKHKNLSTLSNEVILSALKEEKKDDGTAAFPPEICSRFATGNIIMFNHLEYGQAG